jgi:hypothetical protein
MIKLALTLLSIISICDGVFRKIFNNQTFETIPNISCFSLNTHTRMRVNLSLFLDNNTLEAYFNMMYHHKYYSFILSLMNGFSLQPPSHNKHSHFFSSIKNERMNIFTNYRYNLEVPQARLRGLRWIICPLRSSNMLLSLPRRKEGKER